MLELEPKIANALKDELYIPERGNKRSVTERYKKLSEKKVSPSSWGKALFKSSISAIKTVGSAIAEPGVISVGKVALSVKGIYGEANKQLTKKQIGREFKAGVNSERDKADTPGYNDLTELAENVRKQRIQSLAIQKLIISGKYRTASQKEIRAEFQKLKQDVEKTEAAVVSRRGIINKTRIIAKSFVKAHNPFSKYTELDKLRRHKKKLSSLSTARENRTLKTPKSNTRTANLSKDDLELVKRIKTRKRERLDKRKGYISIIHRKVYIDYEYASI